MPFAKITCDDNEPDLFFVHLKMLYDRGRDVEFINKILEKQYTSSARRLNGKLGIYFI